MTAPARSPRSEEHTSELQSRRDLVCRLLLEKKKKKHRDDQFIIKKKKKYIVCEQHRFRSLEIFFVFSFRSSCVLSAGIAFVFFFFFNDTATTEIYTLSLLDALPI